MRDNKEHSVLKEASELVEKKRKFQKWLAIIGVFAVIVMAGVGLGLRYYGQALTRKTTEIECTYQVHQHTEDCYRTSDDGEKELICGLADYVVHSHNDDCYNANADLICPLKEIKEELHQHSDDCYTETEDGKKLTCGKLAVEEHIHNSDCIKVVEEESESSEGEQETKQDDESNTDSKDGTGETSTAEETLTVEETSTAKETTTEETTTAEATTEEATTEEALEEYTRKYADDKYEVIVTYTKEAKIPEYAELVVREITKKDEMFDELNSEVSELMEDQDIDVCVSLDIGFYVDGKEIEPEADVKVSVHFLKQEFEEDAEITIIHNETDGGKVIDTQPVDKDGQISFEAESFSVYTFVTTTKIVTDIKEGTYAGFFEFSYNDTSNAFLSEKYAQYRNDNGALGQVASSFHLVAFDTVKVGCDLNGNILAKNAHISTNDWGTRGSNGNISEISYIQNLTNNGQVGSISERGQGNGKWHALVVGSSNTISSDQNNSFINVGSSTLSKGEAAKYIVKDVDTDAAPFINLDQVRDEISGISYTLSKVADTNVYVDFKSDNNNRYILLTNPNAAGYYNMRAADFPNGNLTGGNEALKILGFKKDSGGNALSGSIIINVDCLGVDSVTFPNEARVYFDTSYTKNSNGSYTINSVGNAVGTNETVDFSAGKVIWNLYNVRQGMAVNNVQNMTGAIIAPGANVKTQNMNGTIIADNIEITGETHRTDFTGTTIPFTAKIYATKYIDGFAPIETDDKFTFQLAEWNGSGWKTIQTKQNVGKDVTFDEMSYGEGDLGVHWYKLTEVKGENTKYQYDTTEYVIKVTVTKSGNTINADYERYKINADEYDQIRISDGKISVACDHTQEAIYENQIVFNNSASTSISVEKKWLDIDGETELTENIPDSLVVQLYQTTSDYTQGKAYESPVTLNKANGWKYTWNDLPKANESGQSFYYYVTENEIPGFTLSSELVYLSNGIYHLVNKKDWEYTYLEVDKQFFMPDGTTPISNPGKGEVQFRLKFTTNEGKDWCYYYGDVTVDGNDISIKEPADKRDPKQAYIFTVNSEQGWKTQFTNLPLRKTDSKNVIKNYRYDVEEVSCNIEDAQTDFNYMDTINGNVTQGTIIIRNKVGNTSIAVNKKWLTYSGYEDTTLQNTSSYDLGIRFVLEQTTEDGKTTGNKAVFRLYADRNIREEGSLGGKECPMLGKYSMKISDLPYYYAKTDGSAGVYKYVVTEVGVVDADGNIDDGYHQVEDVKITTENGLRYYTLTNQSDKAYSLPETGGRGTLLFRIERWWKNIF